MKIAKSGFLSFIFFLLFFSYSYSQQLPQQANPPRLVTDFTNTLQNQELEVLENKLLAFNDTSSTQIAIVILSSLEGYPISDYAIQLAEEWGIGQKEKDNGVLILVAKEDREVFIAVGYGLEGSIPDALAKRIIEQNIKPNFREGAYYQGLDEATNVLIQLSSGEYSAEKNPNSEKTPLSVFFILGLIFFLVLFSKMRSVRNYAGVNHIPFWTALLLMNSGRSQHRGSWSSFSSGSGGFGGFGGGSFGGGGAGGSW